MPKSGSLSLAMRPNLNGGNDNMAPLSPRSPTSPRSEYIDMEAPTPTAPYRKAPESPASVKVHKSSKSIFSNFGATRSSSRIALPENSIRQVPDQGTPQSLYTNGRSGGSTPDLNRPVLTPSSEASTQASDTRNGSVIDDSRSDVGVPGLRTHSSGRSHDTADYAQDSHTKRAPKLKKQGVLTRSRSIKLDEASGTKSKSKGSLPKISPDPSSNWSVNGDAAGLRTAPLEKDKSWRQNIGFGKLRTQSAERHDGSLHPHRDDDASSRRDRADQSSLASGSYNENRGATLMSNIGSGARKVGEKMDSARKGIFGKLGRSSSNHERELQVPKEAYQFKVIHLPLVEQTRLTRISSRLENSKDKTEFWMPALPWRCIDYLNMRGCEEEGLYRVPGAAHQIKFYEQKFDQEHDIDLIADDNLNDPNVIGSLFKNWLRQLPDEIFPKSIQARIQQECQGAKSTPQMLKDELSKLPPFNYYLLFAITCHISLLHSCSEFNKMNYNNLCICFQPAIKIDAFCFQFLILDWRNCWQGCWTEKEFLTEEVKFLEAQGQAQHQPAPPASRNGQNRDIPPSIGKAKSSQSSGYLGDDFKSSAARSNSSDRTKSPGRDDRSMSGRETPPNTAVPTSDTPSRPKREQPSERDASADRTISSSNSREAFNARAPPSRGPGSVNTELQEDDDLSATPTQAQHARGASETQFRLDLNNPPGSPFSVKF